MNCSMHTVSLPNVVLLFVVVCGFIALINTVSKGSELSTDMNESLLKRLVFSSSREYEDMVSVMEQQKAARIQQFRSIPNIREKSSQFAVLYNTMVPEVYCPSLLRIGTVGDGGKWMCTPHALPNNCSIYSLGVNTDTSFERELQGITSSRCRVLSFDKGAIDPSVYKEFDKINAKFVQALISGENHPEKKERTISSIMSEFGDKRIEILKIDIEGSEFTVMPLLMKDAKICQILIEIHGDPPQVVELIKQIASFGYRLFSYEINGYHHILSEYSFIHEDCMQQYSAKPLAYYFNSL